MPTPNPVYSKIAFLVAVTTSAARFDDVFTNPNNTQGLDANSFASMVNLLGFNNPNIIQDGSPDPRKPLFDAITTLRQAFTARDLWDPDCPWANIQQIGNLTPIAGPKKS